MGKKYCKLVRLIGKEVFARGMNHKLATLRVVLPYLSSVIECGLKYLLILVLLTRRVISFYIASNHNTPFGPDL